MWRVKNSQSSCILIICKKKIKNKIKIENNLNNKGGKKPKFFLIKKKKKLYLKNFLKN